MMMMKSDDNIQYSVVGNEGEKGKKIREGRVVVGGNEIPFWCGMRLRCLLPAKSNITYYSFGLFHVD